VALALRLSRVRVVCSLWLAKHWLYVWSTHTTKLLCAER